MIKMILPKKHLPIDESMFGFGAYLLQHLKKPSTIDNLWKIYITEYEESVYSAKFSFDQFIVVIDFLFAVGAVKLNGKGELMYEIDKVDS